MCVRETTPTAGLLPTLLDILAELRRIARRLGDLERHLSSRAS